MCVLTLVLSTEKGNRQSLWGSQESESLNSSLCSSGDAQEPAGIFQTSPEHLQLHGARVEGRVPVGQAVEASA